MSLAVSIIARRETLAEAVEALADRYWNNEPVEDLVGGLTQTFDSLIIDLWRQHFNEISGCALFAVGGYGRAEMAPHSDVDIAFLTAQRHTPWCEQVIEAML